VKTLSIVGMNEQDRIEALSGLANPFERPRICSSGYSTALYIQASAGEASCWIERKIRSHIMHIEH
jgi:hypothetical protein